MLHIFRMIVCRLYLRKQKKLLKKYKNKNDKIVFFFFFMKTQTRNRFESYVNTHSNLSIVHGPKREEEGQRAQKIALRVCERACRIIPVVNTIWRGECNIYTGINSSSTASPCW